MTFFLVEDGDRCTTPIDVRLKRRHFLTMLPLPDVQTEQGKTCSPSLRCGAAWNSSHVSTDASSSRSNCDPAVAKRHLGFHTALRSPASSQGATHVHRSICAHFARSFARCITRLCSSWIWSFVVLASLLVPSVPFERRYNSLSIGNRSSDRSETVSLSNPDSASTELDGSRHA